MLEEFLERPKVAELMHKDYVELSIDTDRMIGGKQIYDDYKMGRDGGLPWLILVDGDGKELITGIGPKGNIGAPVQPEECAHFLEMLKATRKRLTDADLKVMHDELEAHASKHRRPARR